MVMGEKEVDQMDEPVVTDQVAQDNGQRMLAECERAGTVTRAHELRMRLARASRSAL